MAEDNRKKMRKIIAILEKLTIAAGVMFVIVLACYIASGFSKKLLLGSLAVFCCTCIIFTNYIIAKGHAKKFDR